MDIVDRLKNRNTPYGYLELLDAAAKEIIELRARLEIGCAPTLGPDYDVKVILPK